MLIADIFSRVAWLWLNLVLNKGYINALQLTNVPALAPGDSAENMFEFFKSNLSNNIV